jgi:hypothetical protein
MTPWQQYKKKIADAKSIEVKTQIQGCSIRYSEESQKRLNSCLSCEKLISETKQCSECSCFVAHYVILKTQQCPIGKW